MKTDFRPWRQWCRAGACNQRWPRAARWRGRRYWVHGGTGADERREWLLDLNFLLTFPSTEAAMPSSVGHLRRTLISVFFCSLSDCNKNYNFQWQPLWVALWRMRPAWPFLRHLPICMKGWKLDSEKLLLFGLENKFLIAVLTLNWTSHFMIRMMSNSFKYVSGASLSWPICSKNFCYDLIIVFILAFNNPVPPRSQKRFSNGARSKSCD